MQQYRFNFPLFIGLLIGAVVCSGAIYGVWRFQIGRKSGWLLSEAEKSREASDFKEAARYYRDYLTIHPKDEEVRIKYALAQADITESDEITFEDLSLAVGVLESTVRASDISEKPEAKKLRRRLVELYGRDNIRRYPDALEHLNYLLESDPADPDLQTLRAANLARSGNFEEAVKLSYKLVGYDPEADEFDSKKATAANNVELYTNLAATLRAKQDKPELADRVMEQLVENNPKSAEAHLARGRYQMSINDADEARAEIEEAYKLAPKDANVLLSMAEMAAKEEQYDKASEYLAEGKKLFPQDVRFYFIAAGLLMRQEQFDKAITEVDEGIKQVKTNDKVQLMVHKLELQFGKRDLESARQTLADMQKTTTNIRSEFIDFYNARLMMEDRNFNQAATTLNKLRPKMADMGGGRTADVDYYLGLCYENLKQPDMAIKAYDSVLQQNPKNEPAAAGKERARAQIGLQPADNKDDPWAVAYAEEIKKPKAERNWKKLDGLLAKMGEEQKWDDVTKKIRHAQISTMSEDYAGARKLLLEAQKIAPENIGVRRMLIQLTRLDPKLGPKKALELYQQAVDDLGDSPALRLDKADILISLSAGETNKEELKSELATLFAGIDEWTNDQKTELWTGMAGRYLNLGFNSEAREYLNLAADAQPHQLPLRVSLFTLALDANDDAGMKDAQDKILKIVGSTNDSNWLYTEARRMLSLVRRRQLDPKQLDEIRTLVSRALEQRPEWHDLYVLNAELELEAGNLAKALEYFNRAQELGRPAPLATSQHIKLLALSGQIKQAGELLERIPDSLRLQLLGQLYPEILFRTNRVDEALTQARAAIEANPSSPQNHYWYSQLLARSSLAPKLSEQQRKEGMDSAIQEMRKALELQPEFPEGWLSLISYYGQQKDMDQAQAVLREAQLALSGDNLQVFLARSYEALGSWFDAETMYRAIHEAAPDDLTRTQQLAGFYLGNVYQRPDRNLKATPLLNKILRAGSEKKLKPNDPSLLWARRMGAKMLAETGDYQNLLKAENLLASNSQDGALTIDDKLAMAELLAGRPEPLSRKKAIELLEEVAEVQPLSETGEVTLGELYFLTNQEDWRTYSSQMEKAIARFPNSVTARAAYVKNLLNRGDKQSLERATERVMQMRKLAPNHVATFEYTVRLANKLGKKEAARKELMSAVPDMSKATALSEQDVQRLGMLANLLIELDDIDSAEKIYRHIAALNPNRIPGLAAFLGTHRSVDQCFEKLNEVYSSERIPALLQVALSVVRKQREKVQDKFDAQIQTWLDTGLRENPDSITLLMDQADFYDIQKRYKDSADVYRNLLKRDDLTGVRRAIVLNNLSFLVALDSSSATKDIDALKLVEEAKDILGPNPDILDTRAVVRISRKEYQDAIQDLELSVTDNPTASKYFHKAHAHLLAGENRAAVQAWEKAEALGLNHDALNLMEIELFDELKTKIDQIRGASTAQSEGLRRAG